MAIIPVMPPIIPKKPSLFIFPLKKKCENSAVVIMVPLRVTGKTIIAVIDSNAFKVKKYPQCFPRHQI